MLYWLTASPWPGLIFWIILYISDYYITLYSARGFIEIGHIQFEGGFELTPEYQKDVAALKPVSKRHLIALATSSLILVLVWWLTRLNFYLELAYPLFLGMFLLLEVAIHLRHFRNIGLIHEARKHGGMEGQITYKKRVFLSDLSQRSLYCFGFVSRPCSTHLQPILSGWRHHLPGDRHPA